MQTTKVFASSAADLTGFASNVTGATFTLTATDSGDDLAHKVTVRNDSVTDHSGKTLALVGTDASGTAQTETLTAPGTSATATSTKYWLTLTSVTPSATIGADTFDIGWAAASVTPPVSMQTMSQVGFNVGFSCDVTGTPGYSVQVSYGGNWYNHASVVTKTADADGSLVVPVMAMRLIFTAAGTVTLNVVTE